MFSMLLMVFTRFLTLYRVCKVLYKGYGTICKIYASDMRNALKVAVDDPDETWDDKLMSTMDKVFKYKG